jgi:DNA-binding FrmR family transcriptional regulator
LALNVKKPAELNLSHTVREKTKLPNRVRRIRGQVEAVERALEQEIGCSDVLQLITSVRGAINGLMAEVVEDQTRMLVIGPHHGSGGEQTMPRRNSSMWCGPF